MTSIKGVQIGAKLSINFMTNMQKLHRGIWPWTVGLKSRLPLHYKKRYVENWMRDPAAVHYRADPRKYVADKYGEPLRVQNVPIPVTFPQEANQGLWGGEGMIAGFKKKNNETLKPRVAAIWKPFLTSRTFHSEILDRYLAVTVTMRTLDLIDDAFGFDSYILKTHELDMKSTLGMTLKREMLLVLARKSFYPDDTEKRDRIYEKYKQFVIAEDEAEWVGLTLHEAERKQHELEEAELQTNTRPLKHIYAEELAVKLKTKSIEEMSKEEAESKSWLSKLNPFQNTKSKAE